MHWTSKWDNVVLSDQQKLILTAPMAYSIVDMIYETKERLEGAEILVDFLSFGMLMVQTVKRVPWVPRKMNSAAYIHQSIRTRLGRPNG